jgi:hypothetical protein
MAFHLLTFNGLETVASVESFANRVSIQCSSFAIGPFSFTGIGGVAGTPGTTKNTTLITS